MQKIDIPTDTLIIQYVGEKITKTEAEVRAGKVREDAKKIWYRRSIYFSP